MKKAILCLVFMLISGCSSTISKERNVNKICSFKEESMEIKYKIESKGVNENVSNLVVEISLSYEAMGIENVNSLSKLDKKTIEENIKQQAGINNISVDFNDKFVISIEANNDSVKAYLNDSEEESIKLSDVIQNFERKGAVCN